MRSSDTLKLAKTEFLRLCGKTAGFVIDPALPSFETSRVDGKWLFRAPNEVELLYAVYDCAERFFGYDFFEPGTEEFDPAEVKSVPDNGVLVASRTPVVRHCGFIQEFPFDETDTPQLFDFMAKNKLNYLLVWMKYYDELPEYLKEYAAVRGIIIESGHHNFEYLIPQEKYGKSHPEYFAIRGKDADIKALPGVTHASRQLCTTEPGLRKEIARQLLDYCEKNPELSRVGLNPNDGFGWCECPRCSKYYLPDDNRKFRSSTKPGYFYAENAYDEFIGAVAEELHQHKPEIALNFFAYVNYASPAKGFKLTPGIAVQHANYWRCVKHDIFDNSCPTNRGFFNDISAWSRAKAGGEFMIYEYYMGINFYMSLPLFFWKRMFDEFACYKNLAVDGVLTQFQMGHWSVYGSNYRFMAAAARGEEFASAISRFYQRRFGKYAAEAENFFNAASAVMESFEDCHIPTPASLFCRITLAQLEALLPSARKLARKLPGIRPAADLEIWISYLIRFKKLYDKEIDRTITAAEMKRFLAWIKRNRSRRVVAAPALRYLGMWLEDIQNGNPCRFFDVDWVAEFRRRRAACPRAR